MSDFSGVRIKRGAERIEALLEARILEEADWRSLYPKSRLMGVEEIAGEQCYKVALLPSQLETVEWFSLASGLLVQRAAFELSAAGETPTGYTVEKWAEQDGVKQPEVMLAWRGDLQYRVSVLDTVYNVERGRGDFKFPAPVEEYVTAQRAGKALPNAEEIVERHIFESGGPDAYAMLRTQKITGTLTFVERNLAGRMETWAADGGRYYQLTDIPGLGRQEEGSDGRIAWDRSPTIGPRVLPRRDARDGDYARCGGDGRVAGVDRPGAHGRVGAVGRAGLLSREIGSARWFAGYDPLVRPRDGAALSFVAGYADGHGRGAGGDDVRGVSIDSGGDCGGAVAFADSHYGVGAGYGVCGG